MERPLLFVPGFRGTATRGAELARWLGQPDFAAVYRRGEEQKFREAVRSHPPGTAYAIEFAERQDDFVDQSSELTAALAILEQETGLESDVVAHSQGGLVTREHLDRGNDGIHDLVMLGVPNHGVALARLGHLLPLGEGPDFFRDDARHLASLNSRWQTQRSKLDRVVSVAGTRLPVLTGRPPFLAGGDGAVAARSVALEGVEQHTVKELDPGSHFWDDNHSALLRNPGVLALIEQVVSPCA